MIFTTSYDEFALKAFKVNSLDYLLKPVQKEELQAALNKFQKLKVQLSNRILNIDKSGKRTCSKN